MVVLDAIHQIQAEQANDLAVRWNCKAGKCGSCSAEINGKPQLMCMTRLSELPLDKPVTVEPMRGFPPVRDLVTDVSWNFRVKQQIKPFKPRAPDAPGRHLAHGPGGRRPGPGVPQVHRVLSLPGRLPRAPRPSPARAVHRTRDSWSTWPRSRCTPSTSRTAWRSCAGRTASATATSPSAAPRSARSISRSPTTPSFRSRSAWSTSSSTRWGSCSRCSAGGARALMAMFELKADLPGRHSARAPEGRALPDHR